MKDREIKADILDKSSSKLEKYHSRIGRELNKLQKEVHKELEKVVKVLVADLVEYVEVDKETGEQFIPRGKTRSIRVKLNQFEIELRNTYEMKVSEIVQMVSEGAHDEAKELLGDKVNRDKFVTEIMDGITKTKQEDGLNLTARFYRNALVIRQAIETELMYRILSKDSYKEITNKVMKEFRRMHWTISRVIKSEAYATYRMSVMTILKDLGNDFLIKFEEGNCGRPDHHEHTCWTVAREDRHGLGKGIFTASDGDIVYPHVNCTSKLHIITKEDVEDKQDG